MKTLITLLLFMGNAFAAADLTQFFNSYQADQICQKSMPINRGSMNKALRFVYSDKNSDEVYFAFSKNNFTTVVIYDTSTGREREIKFEGNIKDILVENNEVFYLSETTLFIAEKSNDRLISKIRTLPAGLNYQKYGVARGLYVHEGIIYIAHGLYGVMVFDRIYNRHLRPLNAIVPQPNPGHRSMVTDIEGINGKLYFTYDDVTLARNSKAFEGLLIWDIMSQIQHRVIPVNQGKEAYYQSNLIIDGDELIISNLHLNFRHKLSKLETDRYMKPLQRIWRYPKGELIGRAFVKQSKLYGCFHDVNQNKVYAGFMEL
jgi:hypothetical protein